MKDTTNAVWAHMTSDVLRLLCHNHNQVLPSSLISMNLTLYDLIFNIVHFAHSMGFSVVFVNHCFVFFRLAMVIYVIRLLIIEPSVSSISSYM